MKQKAWGHKLEKCKIVGRFLFLLGGQLVFVVNSLPVDCLLRIPVLIFLIFQDICIQILILCILYLANMCHHLNSESTTSKDAIVGKSPCIKYIDIFVLEVGSLKPINGTLNCLCLVIIVNIQSLLKLIHILDI